MTDKPDAKCKNCGCDFAEHGCVTDSIGDNGGKWKCPHPHVETGYGAYKGGDPRHFHPDGECSTEPEIECHRDACLEWLDVDFSGDPSPEVRTVVCMDARFGIGTYETFSDQFFEERESDDE